MKFYLVIWAVMLWAVAALILRLPDELRVLGGLISVFAWCGGLAFVGIVEELQKRRKGSTP